MVVKIPGVKNAGNVADSTAKDLKEVVRLRVHCTMCLNGDGQKRVGPWNVGVLLAFH